MRSEGSATGSGASERSRRLLTISISRHLANKEADSLGPSPFHNVGRASWLKQKRPLWVKSSHPKMSALRQKRSSRLPVRRLGISPQPQVKSRRRSRDRPPKIRVDDGGHPVTTRRFGPSGSWKNANMIPEQATAQMGRYPYAIKNGPLRI